MTPHLGRNAWTRVASPPSDSPCNELSMDARCSPCVPLMGNLSLGHFLVVHSFRPASNGLDSHSSFTLVAQHREARVVLPWCTSLPRFFCVPTNQRPRTDKI